MSPNCLTFEAFQRCSDRARNCYRVFGTVQCEDRSLFSQRSPSPRSASACPPHVPSLHVPISTFYVLLYELCSVNSVSTCTRVSRVRGSGASDAHVACAEAEQMQMQSVRQRHWQRQRHSIQSCAVQFHARFSPYCLINSAPRARGARAT